MIKVCKKYNHINNYLIDFSILYRSEKICIITAFSEILKRQRREFN